MTRQVAETLVSNIKEFIIAEKLPAGARLTERSLAERFLVSRSPIRVALRRLKDEGIMDEHEEGGYVVSARGAQLEALDLPADHHEDVAEKVYLAIAKDRLAGVLPERVTESELTRRYEVTRAQLSGILRRMTQEGWIERLPGHGWRFLPVLTSSETYDQSYRFRILIESAGILEPTFRLNELALKRCQAQQLSLIERIKEVSAAEIFNANKLLHETIAECSGNVFIIDSLRRLNSLRRLMEYQKAFDRDAAARRCREHLVLIDLLLSGQQEAASDFIRLHLRDAAREKSARAAQAVAAPDTATRVA